MRKEIVKRVIALIKKTKPGQLFDTRCLVPDRKKRLLNQDGVTFDFCEEWDYADIIGLTKEEEAAVEGAARLSFPKTQEETN